MENWFSMEYSLNFVLQLLVIPKSTSVCFMVLNLAGAKPSSKPKMAQYMIVSSGPFY